MQKIMRRLTDYLDLLVRQCLLLKINLPALDTLATIYLLEVALQPQARHPTLPPICVHANGNGVWTIKFCTAQSDIVVRLFWPLRGGWGIKKWFVICEGRLLLVKKRQRAFSDPRQNFPTRPYRSAEPESRSRVYKIPFFRNSTQITQVQATQ